MGSHVLGNCIILLYMILLRSFRPQLSIIHFGISSTLQQLLNPLLIELFNFYVFFYIFLFYFLSSIIIIFEPIFEIICFIGNFFSKQALNFFVIIYNRVLLLLLEVARPLLELFLVQCFEFVLEYLDLFFQSFFQIFQ